jgi:hypothetical protein
MKADPIFWLVGFPTFRYGEDVKELARKANLRILDAAQASDADRARAVPDDKAPKLTLKPEYAPAKKSVAKE